MLMLFEFSQDLPPFLCLTAAAVAERGSALLLPCTATAAAATAAAVAVRHKKAGNLEKIQKA